LPPREWRLRVEDILEAIARIQQYVEGLTFEQFQADQKTVDAVVRNLEIIGEAVRHLSANQQGLPGETPWADIAGMRNILIHEYFGVDLTIIWHTIAEDLPKLKVQVQGLLP
jgi:uncharacterized protein with HEPN domain